MNLKALKEELNSAKDAKKALLTNALETRSSLNDEQDEELRQLDAKIEDLKLQIEKTEDEIRKSSVEENIENKGEIKMNKQEQEIRAMESFIKNGTVDEEVREYVAVPNNTGANTAIIPEYLHGEIVRRLEEVAPVFAKARMYPSVAGELKIPREDAQNLWELGFVGEDAEVPEKAFSFDTISLKQVRVGATVRVTQHLLNDTEIDIVSYVVDMLARRLGATLDHHAIVGTGSASSHADLQGLVNLTNATDKIQEVSGVALAGDVFLDAIHAMHPSLLDGAEFYMNRKTYNAVSKLKDQDGYYILKLEKSLAVELPHYTIFGFRVNVTDDMPDNKVLFVNVARACATMVKKGTQLIRISNDTQNALRGTHTFVIDAYVDFRLKDPQAVVKVTIG